jgi:hypothetical protein
MPSVVLYLANQAGISSLTICDARQEVSRIYAQIGVRAVWAEHPTDSPKDALLVIIRARAEQGVGTAELGFAIRAADNSSGRVAYVFYDRVQPLAQGHEMSDASLLAVVIAHEIGHLLLPYGSHSPSGLMRGEWDDRQFSLAKGGQLRFTAQQAELIRGHLRETHG